MNYHVLTLFPEMIAQGVGTSITGRAMKQGLIQLNTVQIRDFSKDKHHKVDDYPYGGGAGMLMQAEVVYQAYQSVAKEIPEERAQRVIYVTPQGKQFSQELAQDFAKADDLIFLCGHYEGIDERVLEEVVTDYVSIGDYVLTGGELAAMVMIDAISRLVPGVLNNEVSAETESFHRDLLEYPQYSRPEVWHGKAVPEVLLSGNQKKIDAWRLEQSIQRTKERRMDLYEKYELMEEIKKRLMTQKLLHIDMLEQINRGRAKLIAMDANNILLYDMPSTVYYHTCFEPSTGRAFYEGLAENVKKEILCMVVHQEELLKDAEEVLGLELDMTCYQMVYTQREQIPVNGLYQADGKAAEGKLLIHALNESHFDFVRELYHTVDNPDYIIGRLKKGEIFGAFLDGNLTGFIGYHDEGSIGMLEVHPNYRGRKIGKALEVFLINHAIKQGFTPYGQVVPGNEVSMKLQNSLGLYASKTPIFWTGRFDEKDK